jgi:hypothetical protein
MTKRYYRKDEEIAVAVSVQNKGIYNGVEGVQIFFVGSIASGTLAG